MSDYMNGTGIQYHLRIKEGDVGKYVILPGDPKRVPLIAGFLRNEDMLSIATHLIAFWDGKSNGTKHMIEIAQKKGIPVWIFNY